jgi:hypothetical protein
MHRKKRYYKVSVLAIVAVAEFAVNRRNKKKKKKKKKRKSERERERERQYLLGDLSNRRQLSRTSSGI